MTSLSQEPLPGRFGVMVSSKQANSLSDEALREAAGLLFDNRVLVLDQQDLDLAEYVAFGRRWGDPILLIARKNRLATFPELIVQSNALTVPEPVRNVANHWHCDSSYEAVAASVTMLLGVKAPASGGETLFADMVAAFEDLPAPERERLESFQVRHAVSAARPDASERIVRPQDLPAELRSDTNVPAPVTHPLVKRHPVTGRKALYGLGGSAFGVVGMTEEAGAQLLADLKSHATAPRFLQSFKLLPRQILLWDNFSVMHRATHIDYSDDPDQARLNYRISLKGYPPGMVVNQE